MRAARNVRVAAVERLRARPLSCTRTSTRSGSLLLSDPPPSDDPACPPRSLVPSTFRFRLHPDDTAAELGGSRRAPLRLAGQPWAGVALCARHRHRLRADVVR